MARHIGKLSVLITTALLLGMLTRAQQLQEDSLRRQFVRYQRQAFQEKVFAHVDKTFYMAGEIIWFKIYDVDGYLNLPMSNTRFAYVELLGNDHRPVLRAKIKLKQGTGDGSFLLPASILSGNYWLRVYTGWMKNFSPEFYFHQQLTIVNSINDRGMVSDRGLSGGPISGGGPGLSIDRGVDSLVSPGYAVQFFPEGGHLVQGLSSQVAFKATGPDGQGLACAGWVLDQKGDTITRCNSTRFGMGSFSLKPQPGGRYRVLLRADATTITGELPFAAEKGYVLRVEDEGADKIRCSVQTGGDVVGFVYLFIQRRHLVRGIRAANLSNGKAVFIIDKKDLGEGISQLTLFNADRIPVCERLYFKRPAAAMRIETTGIASEYKTRTKVGLSVQTTGGAAPLSANLSMSVFRLDSLQPLPQENIINYLFLSSDLQGRIESLQYYFDSTGRITDETMDHLLMTQGWTRFRWDDILQNKTPYFEFLPEMGSSIVQGKVVDRKTGLPVSSVMAYCSIPGTRFAFSTAISRKDGRIRFDIDEAVGSHELIIQTNPHLDSNYRIDMIDPFSDRFTIYPLPGLQWGGKGDADHSKGGADLLGRHIDVQVENAYRAREKHQFLSYQSLDTLTFYGKPDLKYRLEDYTRFTSLEEVMHEYVQDVRLRRQSGDYYFRVRNAPFNNFFDQEPLLLLDGVPVFDPAKLMAIDPTKIAQVDIMNRKFYTGALVNDGIISLRSNEGDLAGYTLDPGAVVMEYEGIQQRREFYTPPYAAGGVSGRLPDNRNQLCWSPDIRTGADGKDALSFYTSDLPGKYALVVQGLSANGMPGYTVVFFNVTP